MCGIFGVYRAEGNTRPLCENALDTLLHRGPDHGGLWSSRDGCLSLGHRRLAIIDLSPLGNQPMSSSSGRYVITFNGEIYNFKDLRKELEALGSAFRGSSDTEVILEGFEKWGLSETLKKVSGMFAFGVWDNHSEVLTLARDRLGEKPLWFGWNGELFAFGSELCALDSLGIKPMLRRVALRAYLEFGYVPAPLTIYHGFYKLPPASYLTLTTKDLSRAPRSDNYDLYSLRTPPIEYWNLKEIYSEGRSRPFKGDFEQAQTVLEELLFESVKGTTISDVPLGAFLSGGVDSSLIVSLMRKVSGQKIRTFSIGFEDKGYNEAPYAKIIAKQLNTDHTEIYLNETEIRDEIISIAKKFDEPFADSSQIPTLLLARRTREYVTVALSGDGGDELFGGYNRYRMFRKIGKAFAFIPEPLRRLACSAFVGVDPIAAFLNARWHKRLGGVAAMLGAKTRRGLYETFLKTHFGIEEILSEEFHEARYIPTGLWPNDSSFKDPQAHDLSYYLPNDILVKLDRSSMAVSLETRIPFLDSKVVSFALSLPEGYIYDNKGGKRILRSLLSKHLPTSMIERPKMGFGVPISIWIRRSLKDWAWDSISSSALADLGLIKPQKARRLFDDHVSGRVNNEYILWSLVVLGQWLEGRGLSSS